MLKYRLHCLTSRVLQQLLHQVQLAWFVNAFASGIACTGCDTFGSGLGGIHDSQTLKCSNRNRRIASASVAANIMRWNMSTAQAETRAVKHLFVESCVLIPPWIDAGGSLDCTIFGTQAVLAGARSRPF